MNDFRKIIDTIESKRGDFGGLKINELATRLEVSVFLPANIKFFYDVAKECNCTVISSYAGTKRVEFYYEVKND